MVPNLGTLDYTLVNNWVTALFDFVKTPLGVAVAAVIGALLVGAVLRGIRS